MQSGYAIAIDGPVASGKGTIAPALAERVHGTYLYTGAMYRSLAYYCLQQGIDVRDAKAVIATLSHLEIELHADRVLLNGVDITDTITDASIANCSSIVSVIPAVRENMVLRQLRIAKTIMDQGKIVVAEGRDTGTKLFPHAAVKFFLTATAEVRAKRRLKQHHVRGDSTLSFEQVLSDTKERDRRDQTRAVDPLIADPKRHGYMVIDSTELSEEETLQQMISELEKRKLL
jgi:CMP/dCMP kinase